MNTTMVMKSASCSECGTPVMTSNHLQGFCPKCLLLLGLGAPPEERKSIGNYEILGQIGKGGMGIVYRAYERSLNRVVALKVLPERLTKRPDLIKRFHREAQAAASLNHPNIVPIFAIGEVEGVHFFTMEMVDGLDLGKFYKEKGGLSPRQVVHIITQATEALKAAHEKGILHRDIKPQNIMIDRSGRVRVMDFGLAKKLDETPDSQLTVEGAFLGTIHYASPEQCSSEPIGPASDLYSLGIVMFELLTGEIPYSSNSTMKIMKEKIVGSTKKISDSKYHFHPSLSAIVDKLLAPSPVDRFKSADELLKALQSLPESIDNESIGTLFPKIESEDGNPDDAEAFGTDFQIYRPGKLKKKVQPEEIEFANDHTRLKSFLGTIKFAFACGFLLLMLLYVMPLIAGRYHQYSMELPAVSAKCMYFSDILSEPGKLNFILWGLGTVLTAAFTVCTFLKQKYNYYLHVILKALTYLVSALILAVVISAALPLLLLLKNEEPETIYIEQVEPTPISVDPAVTPVNQTQTGNILTN